MRFFRLAVLPLALALLPLGAWAQSSNVTVFVNGSRLSFDQPPILQNGRVFVPLRGVFQALGASVVYAGGKIDATAKGRTVSLTIGSTQALVDGRPQYLDQAPFVVNDRTLIPLRFVAQALGATVNWDEADYSVTIVSAYASHPAPRAQVYFTYNAPTGKIAGSSARVQFSLNRPIALGNFHVTLDQSDVTAAVQQSGSSFWLRSPALAPGWHRVRVYGTTNGGIPFDLTWTFSAIE